MRALFSLLLVASMLGVGVVRATPTVYLIGDSAMADRPNRLAALALRRTALPLARHVKGVGD
jgi:hypothetical protein